MDGGPLTPSVPDPPEVRCWCGSIPAARFSDAYLACPACGTLVSTGGLRPEEIPVRDDTRDFYGREYWLSHQREALGLPDIHERAWRDLPERSLYWLRVLLRYQVPPAQVLDVGSAHGAFVALLRWAGFEATGLELSPWVVDFARRTFQVPILQGRIEEAGLPEHSLDVIVLNDVLEHLPAPREAVQRCAALLKPDGLVVVQTPCYPEDRDHASLRAAGHPFLEMLQAREHLFLFSRRAVQQLFEGVGLGVLRFEPALFPYDMFFVAGRRERAETDRRLRQEALLRSPSSRLVHALVQLDDRARDLADRLASLEDDRQERIRMIERLNAHLEQNHVDYEARGRVLTAQQGTIESLTREVERISADSEARLRVITEQQGTIEALTREVERISADADARLRVILEQQGTIESSREHLRAFNEQRVTLEALTREVERIKADADAHLRATGEQRATIETLTGQVQGLRATQEAQDKVVHEQHAMIESLRQHASELMSMRDRLHRHALYRVLRLLGLLPRP